MASIGPIPILILCGVAANPSSNPRVDSDQLRTRRVQLSSFFGENAFDGPEENSTGHTKIDTQETI